MQSSMNVLVGCDISEELFDNPDKSLTDYADAVLNFLQISKVLLLLSSADLLSCTAKTKYHMQCFGYKE